MGPGGLGGGDIDVAGGGADGEICGRLAVRTFSASCTGNSTKIVNNKLVMQTSKFATK